MKSLFPALVIGAIAVDYALTGDRKPPAPAAQPPSAEAAATSSGRAMLSTGDDTFRPVVVEVPDKAAQVRSPGTLSGVPAFDPTAIVPRPASGVPQGMTLSRPELGTHIDKGVEHLDAGMRQLPGYVADYAKNVEKHGLKAFLYDDPELKKAGQAIGEQIGAGIRNIANAAAQDMVAAARDGSK